MCVRTFSTANTCKRKGGRAAAATSACVRESLFFHRVCRLVRDTKFDPEQGVSGGSGGEDTPHAVVDFTFRPLSYSDLL